MNWEWNSGEEKNVRFRSYIIDRELQGQLHHSRLIYNNRSFRTGLPPTITMSDWLIAWQSPRFSITPYIQSCLESPATVGIRTQPNHKMTLLDPIHCGPERVQG
jgi:hypothetical protein